MSVRNSPRLPRRVSVRLAEREKKTLRPHPVPSEILLHNLNSVHKGLKRMFEHLVKESRPLPSDDFLMDAASDEGESSDCFTCLD